ncbi:hypothetical protein QP732_27355 [Klebsiella oxytoca]|uniref:hypothetical protein n=1 Tax=Klebsiella oxytoca TaxID=571 RepID=UPI001CC975DC|nr:hypothetical protein [Klebsiella oxytoca]ELK0735803.1 hypothetical protein [Klebsiella oxytoca]ELW9511643.1 hypothetical protein [Klebsiella oxytoca]MBS6497236.1 hypothetical protein [Klebsiella oxytoca]MBZ7713387.1 hypothetical protein [Klebsiella oxytoca]MDK8003018.1 hypothetical protein [Klebsiella oxytoca]
MKRFILTCSVVLLVVSLAIIVYLRFEERMVTINCRSDFDSYSDQYTLNAYVELYLKSGVGRFMISGDYTHNAYKKTPVKIFSVFDYKIDGELFYIKIREQQSILPSTPEDTNLNLLLPFVLNSRNIEYAFQFYKQPESDYLIKQNGRVLFYCKKMR